jgi:NAD(P)-dependent dehydrogenase (short-subunit alcohol dehydrogenase family)
MVSRAACGQGRAHAVDLASEGASTVASSHFDTINEGSTEADLEETVWLVEKEDQRILARNIAARGLSALRRLADDAVSEFGKMGVLVVNHGIWAISRNSWSTIEETGQERIDILRAALAQ